MDPVNPEEPGDLEQAPGQRAGMLFEHTLLAAESIGVGFWSRNLDAGTAFWDAQMYRIHRRDPRRGPPGFDGWIDEHVHVNDRTWVMALHQRASHDWQAVVDAVFRAPDDGGGERWVQSWTRRLVRNGQRVAFGMHLDVTDRQRNEALLQRERERTRFAIEAAELGIWERQLDGTAGYWNDAMYRLRGLDPADPRPVEELVLQASHPDDLPALNRLVQSHLREGTPYRFEFRVLRPDGQQRWLVTHGRALRDDQGRLLGMAGINLDITERRQADALRQQTERAEQARRDQSAFLARVSHELRTPMNAVLGFAQLLRDDAIEPPSPRQRERLQRIHDAGAQMMTLVDELLALASAESGGDNAETLALADLLPTVLQGWQARAAQHGVALRCGDVPGRVRADRRRLQQLLSHLVGHAVRRQRQGGWVELQGRIDASGDEPVVLLSVQDGGAGCDAAARAALFDLFPAPAAAGPAPDGSGIALALARRMARALGGQLDALGDDGQAPVLCLTLPAVPGPAGTAPQTGPERPLRVLCVEDNPVNLMLVRELLALRPQVRLREAADGTRGIALALAEPPDLLLLDLQLPDIGGLDVLRRLRTEPALSRCMFVVLSANAMPDHIAQARAAGCDDYWTKPIDFPRFLAAIDRLAAAPR